MVYLIIAKILVQSLASYPYFLLIRVVQHGTGLCYNLTVIGLCISKSKTLKNDLKKELKDFLFNVMENLTK